MSISRRIVGSTMLVAASNGVARLVGLAAAPIITSIFGPGPYGVMAIIYAGTSLLTTVSLGGIDNSYARYYFSSEGDEAGVEVFCWRFALVSSLLFTGGVVALVNLVQPASLGGESLLLLAAGVLSVLGVIRVMAETRRRLQGRYGRIAIGLISAGALTPALSVLLGSHWKPDARSLLVAALLGVLANIVALGLPGPSRVLRGPSVEMGRRWEIVSLGLPGIVTAAMFWALGFADRWILAAFTDREVVGIYAFAASLGSLGVMLNSALTLTWFPEAVRTYESDRQVAGNTLGRLWARLVLGLVLVWLVVASIGGDVLRLLADARFHSGAIYIPWVALGVLFSGVASLANTGLMLAKNLRPAAYTWAGAGVISIALNLVIVPWAGALGAAIVGSIAYGCVCFVVMAIAQRLCPLVIPWGRLATAVAIVFVLGGWMSTVELGSPLTSSVSKLGVTSVVALISASVVAPDWITKVPVLVVSQLRSRIRGG